MHSYTEQSVLKVRRELLRLGCQHDEIMVMQYMADLRLVHGNQELIANPFEVLATLKSIRRPVQVIDIWAILCLSQQEAMKKSNHRIKLILLAAVACLISLLLVVMNFV